MVTRQCVDMNESIHSINELILFFSGGVLTYIACRMIYWQLITKFKWLALKKKPHLISACYSPIASKLRTQPRLWTPKLSLRFQTRKTYARTVFGNFVNYQNDGLLLDLSESKKRESDLKKNNGYKSKIYQKKQFGTHPKGAGFYCKCRLLSENKSSIHQVSVVYFLSLPRKTKH